MDIKLKAGKKYSFCSCGLSRSLPFCDNTHREFNATNGMEYKSVKITSKKDTHNKIDVTKNFLIKNKMPYNYRITENTAFGYDPNNKKLIEYFNHFWKLYSKENLTHRDQIIWGFICWKYNIYPIIYKKNEKDLKKRRIHNYLFKYNKDSVGFNEHTYT